MNRANCLKEIVEFGAKRAEAKSTINGFGFDSDVELYQLSKGTFLKVVEMYLAGSIDSKQLEDWASFIECREDIDYMHLSDQIYQLANPLLTAEITPGNVEQIASKVKSS